jgi:3-hydroxybutyryl-CoA dehydrogenase
MAERGFVLNERVAVVGSGAIACALASVAGSRLGESVLVARSEESADRARGQIAKTVERLDGDPSVVIVTTDYDALADRTYVVEAIVEDLSLKAKLLAKINMELKEPKAVLASTTSSLSVEHLALASGRPSEFAALHVFNPVARMELIELAYPTTVNDDTKERTEALCAALGKTGVEVADEAGFVVNRLLFSYLFDAVTVMEQQGLTPVAVDTCMKLGAGHPMGPLALLDLVGLDVSVAIGESIGVEIPQSARDLIAQGHRGKKTGRGYHDYSGCRKHLPCHQPVPRRRSEP